MKILCTKENLMQGVQIVQRAVSSKTALPILSGILLKTDANRLRLTATDLELGIDCSVPVQVIEEGSVVVPARIFSEIVKKLPDTPIEIALTPQSNSLTVRYNPSQITVNGMNPEEFPVIPDLEGNYQISVKSSIFKSMVKQVAFSAANDENRPIFTGVLVIIENGIFKTVATDTHRLAYRTATLEMEDNINWQAIVPAKTLVEVTRLIQEDNDILDIIVADNQVMFKFDSITLVSRLIEGQFPNYKQVIPSSCKTKIRVHTKALLEAAERASLLAREGSNVIKLKTQENALVITSDSPDLGRVYEEVYVDLQGEEAQIAFNSRYLLDVLKVIDSEEIVLELTGSLSPGIIRPIEISNYLYLILPVRTS